MKSSFSANDVAIATSNVSVQIAAKQSANSVETNNNGSVEVETGNGIQYGSEISKKNSVALPGLIDKQILMLGDSIMGNDRVNGVPDFVRKFTGATVYNGGLAGTCLCRRTEVTSSICLDAPNIVDALISGDFSAQIKQAENLANPETGNFLYFPEACEMMSKLNMKNIDLVTIAYGTNDWKRAHSKEYILSELEYIIDRFQTNLPWVRLLIITPIYRYFGDKESDGDSDTRTSVSGVSIGYTLKNLTSEIEQKAKDKRVSCLNAYQEMQLSRNNATTYFDEGDKTHINAKGNEMYGSLIAGKIFDMFGCIHSGSEDTPIPETSMTKSEIEALIESIVLNGYLGGKKIRYVDDANDGGVEGYLTIKKG